MESNNRDTTNKIIMDFMGVEVAPEYIQTGKSGLMSFKDGQYVYVDYDVNWQSLMLVVEKIKDVSNKKEISKPNYELYQRGLQVFGLSVSNSIEDIYNGCVAFIEYYNQHPTN